MAFYFNVETEDNTYEIIPSEVDRTRLESFDKYTLKKGFGLKNRMREENNIPSTIEKITIRPDRGNYEFSIVTSNPYLSSIIDKIVYKDIQLPGENYIRENTSVIDIESEEFGEMKDYIISKLETEEHFLRNMFGEYNNDIRNIMARYQNAVRNNQGNYEDVRNIEDLKTELTKYLSLYKNYRKVSIKRLAYEENLRYGRINNINVRERQEEIIRDGNNIDLNKLEYQVNDVVEYNSFINYSGEEKEEFLEEDEINDSHRY